MKEVNIESEAVDGCGGHVDGGQRAVSLDRRGSFQRGSLPGVLRSKSRSDLRQQVCQVTGLAPRGRGHRTRGVARGSGEGEGERCEGATCTPSNTPEPRGRGRGRTRGRGRGRSTSRGSSMDQRYTSTGCGHVVRTRGRGRRNLGHGQSLVRSDTSTRGNISRQVSTESSVSTVSFGSRYADADDEGAGQCHDDGYGTDYMTPQGNSLGSRNGANSASRIPAPPRKSKEEVQKHVHQRQEERRSRTVNAQVLEVQQIGAAAALDLDNSDLSQAKAIKQMLKRNQVIEGIVKVFQESGVLPKEEKEEKEESLNLLAQEEDKDSEMDHW